MAMIHKPFVYGYDTYRFHVQSSASIVEYGSYLKGHEAYLVSHDGKTGY